MKALEDCFASRFAHWAIRLPEDHVAQRRRGKINQAGWTIWFLFGKDDRGEYLDYYASHRMTSDEHVRIYADGEVEELEALLSLRLTSQDPEDDRRLEAEYFAENRRISNMLEEKGFLLSGDEPLSNQLGRVLREGKID